MFKKQGITFYNGSGKEIHFFFLILIGYHGENMKKKQVVFQNDSLL
jgi:hypothetical protein